MRLGVFLLVVVTVFSGMLIAQTSPAPTINQLTPGDVSPGKGDLKLTVIGTGFVPDSVVSWNGTRLITVFTSSSQLIATVPATDTATAGTASITVMNPGGITSASKTFVVELIIFDKSHLNLLMSAVVLLGGLGIYWFWHPKVFRL